VNPKVIINCLKDAGVYRPYSLKAAPGTNAAWRKRKRNEVIRAMNTRVRICLNKKPKKEPRQFKTSGMTDRERFEYLYANDLVFRLKHVLRSRVRKVVKRAQRYSEHTLDWLGCTPLELIAHLEKQWQRGMSWSNYGCGVGQWSIDHIRPCASFDLLRADHRAACFHYTNLQPLWHIDNILKNDRWDGDYIKNEKFSNMG